MWHIFSLSFFIRFNAANTIKDHSGTNPPQPEVWIISELWARRGLERAALLATDLVTSFQVNLSRTTHGNSM